MATWRLLPTHNGHFGYTEGEGRSLYVAIKFIWGINVNWDAVGAISETVGAIVVVVSLVYLAVQIKKNTNLAKSEYHTTSVAGAARFFHWKSANLENAQIFTTGMKDFRALSIKERVILDGVLN